MSTTVQRNIFVDIEEPRGVETFFTAAVALKSLHKITYVAYRN